ncbi:hypothetical protein FGO68_gene6389 [Halteria grandinella]|uniref:Uncharacterized protein n=1 Tax=Halteria grandinella TaxID=5974 RepID=A0A8J8T5H5_HALGN|nr:hypothetical protein FGO68_gene6389 [Halteria grandinella]
MLLCCLSACNVPTSASTALRAPAGSFWRNSSLMILIATSCWLGSIVCARQTFEVLPSPRRFRRAYFPFNTGQVIRWAANWKVILVSPRRLEGVEIVALALCWFSLSIRWLWDGCSSM